MDTTARKPFQPELARVLVSFNMTALVRDCRVLAVWTTAVLMSSWLAATAAPAGMLTPAQYREQAVSNALRSADKVWRSLDKPPVGLGVREVFMAGLAYCEGHTNLDRLERLFETAAQMQDTNANSRGYGNFRWSWGHEGVYDYNAVDFSMQTAAMLWSQHQGIMPGAAKARLRGLIGLGIEGLRRHRVAETYSNIALMNAGDLILLGEALGDTQAAEEGYARLDRVLLGMWESGIHEYDSPTYYGVDLEDLELLEAFCQRERGRAQARMLLEYYWTDIALNWFPAAQKLAGTHSRDYDYLRGLGMLDEHLLADGWLESRHEADGRDLLATYCRWPRPERLLRLARTKFPRYVEQVWGFEACQGRIHYLCRDVTLSASGAAYGGRMDLPLTADLPGDRERTRCYFIPDGRHDPYGKAKINESKAHSKALHLNPLWTAVQRKSDALGLVVYREADSTDASLESHWVMPLEADGFWVNETAIRFSAGHAAEWPVRVDEPVVLRQGTAAVGVRVPWARGLDGKPASMSLVYDGNPYGAVRLTVNHHAGRSSRVAGTNAAAVFWVRIGSSLDEGAFQTWKKDFALARSEVRATSSGIEATAAGAEGPLSVAAANPFRMPSKLNPPYRRMLLALDGDDIGRKLLSSVEPGKSYAAALAPAKPVEMQVSGAVVWEAEAGRLIPPFCPGQHPAASGGTFVWMPAQPGERAASSIASACYVVHIRQAGKYYLWGRVLSPTPENDSFYVKCRRGDEVLMDTTAWPLGVHKQWTWTRFNGERGKEALPLSLPAGEINLELRVREAGTKIDRLYLSLRPEERPSE